MFFQGLGKITCLLQPDVKKAAQAFNSWCWSQS